MDDGSSSKVRKEGQQSESGSNMRNANLRLMKMGLKLKTWIESNNNNNKPAHMAVDFRIRSLTDRPTLNPEIDHFLGLVILPQNNQVVS